MVSVGADSGPHGAGRTRHEPLWLALGLAGMGAVGYVSLVPQPPGPDVPMLDKIEHVAAYAGLALWFGALRPGWRWRAGWAAAVLAYGALVELLQALLTATRLAEPGDVVANMAGVAVGMWLCRTPLGKVHRRLEAGWLHRTAGGGRPCRGVDDESG